MAGGGGAGGLSESVLRKVLLSYCYVAVWIFLSFAVIVYNKYILDPKMYNWPFPISLTMIHMTFCSSLAVGLVRVLRVVDPPSSPPMSPQLYTSSIVPIGAENIFVICCKWIFHRKNVMLELSNLFVES